MNYSELKVIMYNEKKTLEELLRLLEKQYELIMQKDVFAIDKLATDIQNISVELAKCEVNRRNVVGEHESMKTLVEESEDIKLKEVYKEVVSLLRLITLQKDTNETLLKQELIFTKKIMNIIKPNANVTYNASGQIK